MAAGAAYERGLGDWAVSFELHVDRLFDNDDALIFGFPEPGRVLRLGVSIAPRSTTPLLSLGAPR
jgi:hypothetical protein